MQNADPSTAYAVPLPFQGRQAKCKIAGKAVEAERYSPPSKEAEKFFGDSAPLKGELSVRTEGFSRK